MNNDKITQAQIPANAIKTSEIASMTTMGEQISGYDFSIHTNPDAMAWVKFFRECNPDCNIKDDVMLGWFSNAMMAMHDHLKGNPVHNGDHAQYLLSNPQKEAPKWLNHSE